MMTLRTTWSKTYTSFVPVLTPQAAGKAMMVSPKTLVAHLVMFITGDVHPDDCECAVCSYRRDNSAEMQVKAQRKVNLAALDQVKSDVTTWAQTPCFVDSGERITSDEATYWTQWTEDHFPASTAGDTWMSLFASLDDVSVDRVPEILLDHIVEAERLGLNAEDLATFNNLYFSASTPQEMMNLLLYLGSVEVGMVEV